MVMSGVVSVKEPIWPGATALPLVSVTAFAFIRMLKVPRLAAVQPPAGALTWKVATRGVPLISESSETNCA